MLKSKSIQRIQQLYNHLYPPSTSKTTITSGGRYKRNHEPLISNSYSKPFRTIHTGIVNDPDSATFERKAPLRLDLRNFKEKRDETSPYTSLLLLDHIFHTAKLLHSRHIHLKYIEASGDCYIMFRTEYGLVTYSTINNKHWIRYMMMHATGLEDPEKAGEGEFRLEVLTDRDGRMEFTVNIVYIQGGVKLTISPID
jgi:hypothetical protein